VGKIGKPTSILHGERGENTYCKHSPKVGTGKVEELEWGGNARRSSIEYTRLEGGKGKEKRKEGKPIGKHICKESKRFIEKKKEEEV